ncbi:MAG: addiction module protein [bacterium]
MMNDAESAEIEAAWVAEANDRLAAYHNGEISSQSVDEVFAEINRKYGA